MDDLTRTTATTAVVHGAPGTAIQNLFRTLAARWRESSRLAGVIAEDHGLPDRACSAGYLLSLSNGARYSIFQDLGAGSTDCHLSGDGAVSAAEAVRRDIARGCDLVLLSKFDKLEAAGGGLRDAFLAAIEAGVPVLTSVSPPQRAAWQAVAGSAFVELPAEASRIDAWWQAVRAAR